MRDRDDTIRAPLLIMKASVYALMIRNIEQRFIVEANSNRFRDLLRIFLEPVGHILLWSMAKVFRYQEISNGLDPILFILLGVLPWLFTHSAIAGSLNLIAKNKGLLCFKQIKLLDPVIALLLSELMTIALVFCCGLFIISLLEIDWHLQNPVHWFLAALFYFFTIMGVAFFVSCLGFFSKNLIKFFKLLLRTLYLFSGVFFSAQMLSPELGKYFAINPLFQFIELSRDSFSNSSDYFLPELGYLFHSALVCMFIGLGTYMLLRKKIMTEIMNH